MEDTQIMDMDFSQSLLNAEDNISNLAGWIEITGKRNELRNGITKVGRDASVCKIIIENEKTISKVHAQFEVEGSCVMLVDLNSRNKSRIERMILKPNVRYALKGGEALRFGAVHASYVRNLVLSDTESDECSESMLDASTPRATSKKQDVSESSDDDIISPTPQISSKPRNTISNTAVNLDFSLDFIPETPLLKNKRNSPSHNESPSTSFRKTHVILESPSTQTQSTPAVQPNSYSALKDFISPPANLSPIPVSENVASSHEKYQENVSVKDSSKQDVLEVAPIDFNSDVSTDIEDLFDDEEASKVNISNKKDGPSHSNIGDQTGKESHDVSDDTQDVLKAFEDSVANENDNTQDVLAAFEKPTQHVVDDDIFDAVTQQITYSPKQNPFKKPLPKSITKRKDYDIFDAPTQVFSLNRQEESDKNDEMDIFDAPTQIFNPETIASSKTKICEAPTQRSSLNASKFKEVCDPAEDTRPSANNLSTSSISEKSMNKTVPSKPAGKSHSSSMLQKDISETTTQKFSRTFAEGTRSDAPTQLHDSPTQILDVNILKRTSNHSSPTGSNRFVTNPTGKESLDVSDDTQDVLKAFEESVANENDDTQDVLAAFEKPTQHVPDALSKSTEKSSSILEKDISEARTQKLSHSFEEATELDEPTQLYDAPTQIFDVNNSKQTSNQSKDVDELNKIYKITTKNTNRTNTEAMDAPTQLYDAPTQIFDVNNLKQTSNQFKDVDERNKINKITIENTNKANTEAMDAPTQLYDAPTQVFNVNTLKPPPDISKENELDGVNDITENDSNKTLTESVDSPTHLYDAPTQIFNLKSIDPPTDSSKENDKITQKDTNRSNPEFGDAPTQLYDAPTQVFDGNPSKSDSVLLNNSSADNETTLVEERIDDTVIEKHSSKISQAKPNSVTENNLNDPSDSEISNNEATQIIDCDIGHINPVSNNESKLETKNVQQNLSRTSDNLNKDFQVAELEENESDAESDVSETLLKDDDYNCDFQQTQVFSMSDIQPPEKQDSGDDSLNKNDRNCANLVIEEEDKDNLSSDSNKILAQVDKEHRVDESDNDSDISETLLNEEDLEKTQIFIMSDLPSKNKSNISNEIDKIEDCLKNDRETEPSETNKEENTKISSPSNSKLNSFHDCSDMSKLELTGDSNMASTENIIPNNVINEHSKNDNETVPTPVQTDICDDLSEPCTEEKMEALGLFDACIDIVSDTSLNSAVNPNVPRIESPSLKSLSDHFSDSDTEDEESECSRKSIIRANLSKTTLDKIHILSESKSPIIKTYGKKDKSNTESNNSVTKLSPIEAPLSKSVQSVDNIPKEKNSPNAETTTRPSRRVKSRKSDEQVSEVEERSKILKEQPIILSKTTSQENKTSEASEISNPPQEHKSLRTRKRKAIIELTESDILTQCSNSNDLDSNQETQDDIKCIAVVKHTKVEETSSKMKDGQTSQCKITSFYRKIDKNDKSEKDTNVSAHESGETDLCDVVKPRNRKSRAESTSSTKASKRLTKNDVDEVNIETQTRGGRRSKAPARYSPPRESSSSRTRNTRSGKRLKSDNESHISDKEIVNVSTEVKKDTSRKSALDTEFNEFQNEVANSAKSNVSSRKRNIKKVDDCNSGSQVKIVRKSTRKAKSTAIDTIDAITEKDSSNEADLPVRRTRRTTVKNPKFITSESTTESSPKITEAGDPLITPVEPCIKSHSSNVASSRSSSRRTIVKNPKYAISESTTEISPKITETGDAFSTPVEPCIQSHSSNVASSRGSSRTTPVNESTNLATSESTTENSSNVTETVVVLSTSVEPCIKSHSSNTVASGRASSRRTVVNKSTKSASLESITENSSSNIESTGGTSSIQEPSIELHSTDTARNIRGASRRTAVNKHTKSTVSESAVENNSMNQVTVDAPSLLVESSAKLNSLNTLVNVRGSSRRTAVKKSTILESTTKDDFSKTQTTTEVPMSVEPSINSHSSSTSVNIRASSRRTAVNKRTKSATSENNSRKSLATGDTTSTPIAPSPNSLPSNNTANKAEKTSSSPIVSFPPPEPKNSSDRKGSVSEKDHRKSSISSTDSTKRSARGRGKPVQKPMDQDTAEFEVEDKHCISPSQASTVFDFQRRENKRTSSRSSSPAKSTKSARSSRYMRETSPHLDSNFVLSSPGQRQAVATKRPRVLFTTYKDAKDEKIVKETGGLLVESSSECSVLVMGNVRRTCKFMACVARGVPIVSAEWISASKKAGSFVDPWHYIISDREAEQKFGFSLSRSLKMASKKQLLKGYSIYVTDEVKPPPDQMKEIVECAGGDYLETPPKMASPFTVVVSCEEDRRRWNAFKKLKLHLVSAEFILTGILRQKIMVEEFRL